MGPWDGKVALITGGSGPGAHGVLGLLKNIAREWAPYGPRQGPHPG